MTTMLITRPDPDAAASAERLRALGIAAVTAPMLVRKTLGTSLPPPAGFAAMAITSANAVRSLAERESLAPYLGLKVFAVGDRSAEEASLNGFTDIESAGGSLGDLAERLAHAGLTGPVFHPCGTHQAGDLAKSLAPFGVMVVAARIYDMVPVTAMPDGVTADLCDQKYTAALFYSRRTAEAFVSLVGDSMDRAARTHLAVLCLSAAIAEPLLDAHFVRVSLADYPSEEAMMSLALSFARDQNAS